MFVVDIEIGARTIQLVIVDDIWDDQDAVCQIVTQRSPLETFVLQREGFKALVKILGYAQKTPGARLSSTYWMDRYQVDAVKAALDYRDGEPFPNRIVRNKPHPDKVKRGMETLSRLSEKTTATESVLELPAGWDW